MRVVHDLTDGERALVARRAETEATVAGPVLLERPEVDWERHRGDKRPKILPPPGEVWRNPGTNRKIGHRYYTRVTTFADAITEGYNLTAWKLRRLALGAGQRPDYVALAASYTDTPRDRDALDELVGKMLEAAGPNKADLGTALHGLTERLDRGEDLGNPPAELLPDLAAYAAVTEGELTMLLREPRTVCDELECAGTPDTIAIVTEQPPQEDENGPRCDCPPDRPRVVDTKTGSIAYPGKMSTQLSIYAHSDLYDPETGERTPLDVCPHWGVIVHLPVETGEAALFWLDLEHGWRGAQLCGPVRTWHRAKADDILRPFASAHPVKVVDGEVTRITPRLASTRRDQPAEPADITAALEASNAHVQQLKREAADAQERAEAAEVAVEQRAAEAGVQLDPDPGYLENGDDLGAVLKQRDDEGDEAALHEDLADEHRAETAAAAHEASGGQYGAPFDPEVEPRVPEDVVDVTTRHGKVDPLGPYPVSLAQAMQPEGKVLHETRRPGSLDPVRQAFADAAEAPPGDLAATLAGETVIPMPPGPDTCAHSGGRTMVGGQLVCRDCREPAGFADGTAIVTPPATAHPVAAEEYDATLPEWPGVDDLEQLASGPDSDAEDEPVEPPPSADPLGDEIRHCASVRELELLGTRRWREWTEAHRALAVEVHDRLDRAERVERPRAAYEVALMAATTQSEVETVMQEVPAGSEWLDDDLRALASTRWRELRGQQ